MKEYASGDHTIVCMKFYHEEHRINQLSVIAYLDRKGLNRLCYLAGGFHAHQFRISEAYFFFSKGLDSFFLQFWLKFYQRTVRDGRVRNRNDPSIWPFELLSQPAKSTLLNPTQMGQIGYYGCLGN